MNSYTNNSSLAGQTINADEQAALGLLSLSRGESHFHPAQTVICQGDVEMRDIDDEVLSAAGTLMTMKDSDQATKQEGNVFARSEAQSDVSEPPSDDEPASASDDNGDEQNSTSSDHCQKRDSSGSDADDEYVPSQYHRNHLGARGNFVRRSTRKTHFTPSPPSDVSRSAATSPYSSTLSSASRPHSPNLDPGEGFMPSAENEFKFKYDSPTGRTAAELDDLLRLPPHPKQFPTDLKGQKNSGIKKGYRQLVAKPKKGLADECVAWVETEHREQVEKEEKRVLGEYE